MKIAILTLPLHTNYGGMLQAYALQSFLQQYGHNVIVINRVYPNCKSLIIILFRLVAIVKSLFRRWFLGKKQYIIVNPLSPSFRTTWNGLDHLPFIDERFVLSPKITNSTLLRKYVNKTKFDCIIVGSDQVWRPRYSPCLTDYFLKPVIDNAHCKKIAYAASFGVDLWEFTPEQTCECAELVKKFDAISVREISGVKLCKEKFNIDAQHLLDPTMLLDEKDYINLFQEKAVNSGNLFCYILDNNPEIERIIKNIVNEGYVPYTISTEVIPTSENPYPVQPSVEEWLRSVYDAELVLTDSFHACVFAIIFSKPFVVLGNKKRGYARFESLLEMFKLRSRLVYSYEDFLHSRDSLLDNLDLLGAQQVIQDNREKSVDFFRNCGLVI